MNYKKIILLLSIFALVFTTACDDDDDDDTYGNWVELGDFSNNSRSDAVSFTIGETFYYGLGYNGNNSYGEEYMSDFYAFSGGDSWTKLASFPGTPRAGAVSFAVDGKGYMLCGENENEDSLYSDVWEYDAGNNAWTQLADFPGGKRADGTAFVVGGVAYVVAGRTEDDGDKKDCYIFDPSTKTFTYGVDLDQEKKRYGATSFVIGDRAYVLGGYHGGFVTEVEVFDGVSKKWVKDVARDIYLSGSITDDISYYDDPLDLRRAYAASFVIEGKAYLFSGNNGNILSDCWEYDTTTDLWTEMNSFPYTMSGRSKATAFSLKDVPYLVGGTNGTSYFDDVWTFEPTEEEDDTDD